MSEIRAVLPFPLWISCICRKFRHANYHTHNHNCLSSVCQPHSFSARPAIVPLYSLTPNGFHSINNNYAFYSIKCGVNAFSDCGCRDCSLLSLQVLSSSFSAAVVIVHIVLCIHFDRSTVGNKFDKTPFNTKQYLHSWFLFDWVRPQ